MDSKKPENEGKSPAEKRVDTLISGKPSEKEPEPGQASQRLREQKQAEARAAISGKPVLTEKQRIEARRKRQAKKRRPVTGNPLSKGVKAAAFEVQRTALFLGRGLMSGFDQLKPALESVKAAFIWLAGRIGHGLLLLVALIGRLLNGLGRLLLSLDRLVNARQAFILLAVVAAGLLLASQFSDYRAIEIGQPGYSAVQDITRAPRSEVKTPIDTHSFLLVAAGIVALVAAALTVRSRKRVLGLVVAAAGGITLAVTIAIDLPAGLDAKTAKLSYSGVNAILLSGFWLELAAGAVLFVSGMALMLQSSASPATSRDRGKDRSRSRDERTRERDSDSRRSGAVAGGQA